LGTVRFTIRGGRLRYKRYDAHFKKKSSVELAFSSFGDHLINILRKVNRLIYAFKINNIYPGSFDHPTGDITSIGSSRGETIHFFHKRYISPYLICITIRFIGNCNYSVDMGAAIFFFIYD
jgi:hypothetical protein